MYAVQFKNVDGLTAPVGLFGVFDGEHGRTKGPAATKKVISEPGIHDLISVSHQCIVHGLL